MTGTAPSSHKETKEISQQCKASSTFLIVFPVACKAELLKQMSLHVNYIHFT